MDVAQLAMLIDPAPKCGHTIARSHDRVGEYALVCCRRPHDEAVAHDYLWETVYRRTEPIVVTGGVL